MFILVFSIVMNMSGLSDAHVKFQTSVRLKLVSSRCWGLLLSIPINFNVFELSMTASWLEAKLKQINRVEGRSISERLPWVVVYVKLLRLIARLGKGFYYARCCERVLVNIARLTTLWIILSVFKLQLDLYFIKSLTINRNFSFAVIHAIGFFVFLNWRTYSDSVSKFENQNFCNTWFLSVELRLVVTLPSSENQIGLFGLSTNSILKGKPRVEVQSREQVIIVKNTFPMWFFATKSGRQSTGSSICRRGLSTRRTRGSMSWKRILARIR